MDFIKEQQIKIKLLAFRLFFLELLKCLLVGIIVFFIAFAITKNKWVSGVIGLLTFGAFAFQRKLLKSRKDDAKLAIHLENPQLEHSLALIEKQSLNNADKLQLERISNQKVKTPFHVDFGLLGLFLVALASFSLTFLPQKLRKPNLLNENKTANQKVEKAVPKYVSTTLKITPPTYSGIAKIETNVLNATALVGSILEWRVKFDNAENLKVVIENSRGKEIGFKNNKSHFTYLDQLITSGFYSIKAYERDSLVYQSPYYRIEAISDNPPKIEPSSKELYKTHTIKDPSQIQISAKISDDIKVSHAFLVATVARGSGENVKFREVKWPLEPNNFKEARINKNIDLKGLNFAPGDELYYYWAAFDNRVPEPNFTKSDTYFVVFKDTSGKDETDQATMAMNILPEYFRSQRQIIIDTEKLIKKRKKIKEPVFKSESNEIGYDQKVLRLRYGQYLGEEFENSIGPASNHEGEEDFMKGFVHAHDSEEQEDNHVEEHHDHGGSPNTSDEKDPLAALMAEYVHSHDDAETNTFYEQSTRSLLKMALEQMWQSELHLRLYEPEKALPFENKALEYLKQAQQKARVYVKKTGFDPPPIKEKEKRLTGELTKFNAKQQFAKSFFENETMALTASLIDILEKQKIDSKDQQKMVRLGQALSEIPNFRNNILKDLQSLINSKTINNDQKLELKNKIIGLLNFENQRNKGGSPTANQPKLETVFRNKLK